MPIFWIEGEDHDWDEVKKCGVFNADLASCQVSLGDPPGARQTAVARVRLDDSAAGAIAELASLLQQTEFSASLLESLRQAYQTGAGMTDAFGRWLETTLGSRGLVVYDASDPAAKPLVADLFARELETAGTTARLAKAAGDALQAKGYHAQAIAARGRRGPLLLEQRPGGDPARRPKGSSSAITPRQAATCWRRCVSIRNGSARTCCSARWSRTRCFQPRAMSPAPMSLRTWAS